MLGASTLGSYRRTCEAQETSNTTQDSSTLAINQKSCEPSESILSNKYHDSLCGAVASHVHPTHIEPESLREAKKAFATGARFILVNQIPPRWRRWRFSQCHVIEDTIESLCPRGECLSVWTSTVRNATVLVMESIGHWILTMCKQNNFERKDTARFTASAYD